MIHWFMTVVNMSIAASLLLVLILTIRQIMSRYSTAGFQYLLWLPLLFRLLVPYSLPSMFSIYNLFQPELASPGGMLMSVAYLEDPHISLVQEISDGQGLLEKQLLTAGCAVWLCGTVVFLAVFIVQYVRLWLALRVSYPVSDDQLGQLAVQAGLRHTPIVLYTNAVHGPLVFGVLFPRVLLPLQMRERNTVDRYILLHEFSHISCWDYGIMFLSCLALALHWFNPLVWLARRWMVRDIEHACDQRVLRGVSKEEQLDYAQTLVNWAGHRRFGIAPYASFGEQDVKKRVKAVLAWHRLPHWVEVVLGCILVCIVFCTVTNAVLPNNYLPVSSPFVSERQREEFRQSVYRLVDALERGDSDLLVEQASMDPAYFAGLYAQLEDVAIQVDSIRLYCNSNTSAEAYLHVTMEDHSAVQENGSGMLVAHLIQTEYRAEPFVDYLMPQQKYENMRMADKNNAAAQLAMRLCANLNQPNFQAETLSPVTVARVCMASAIEEKNEGSPFSEEQMRSLAKEYFNLDHFSCTDPSVYDAENAVYVYRDIPQPRMCVTEMEQLEGDLLRVVVECYDDPMCLFPLRRMECEMKKTD